MSLSALGLNIMPCIDWVEVSSFVSHYFTNPQPSSSQVDKETMIAFIFIFQVARYYYQGFPAFQLAFESTIGLSVAFGIYSLRKPSSTPPWFWVLALFSSFFVIWVRSLTTR